MFEEDLFCFVGYGIVLCMCNDWYVCWLYLGFVGDVGDIGLGFMWFIIWGIIGRYFLGGEEFGRFLGMCVSGVFLFLYGFKINEVWIIIV